MKEMPTLHDAYKARCRIKCMVRETPLIDASEVESLKAGKPVQVEEKHSIADSLLGGIGFDNQFTLPMVEKFVDDHLLISEEEIKDGMLYLFETHRTIVEGAAAVGVGAMLNSRVNVDGKRVVSIVSGGAIDSTAYLQIIQERLEKKHNP